MHDALSLTLEGLDCCEEMVEVKRCSVRKSIVSVSGINPCTQIKAGNGLGIGLPGRVSTRESLPRHMRGMNRSNDSGEKDEEAYLFAARSKRGGPGNQLKNGLIQC